MTVRYAIVNVCFEIFYFPLTFSGIFGAALGLFHSFLLSTELSNSMGIINSLNKVSHFK